MMRCLLLPVLSLGAALMLAGLARGGIEGSKHDFSQKAWSKDDSCGACHTPQRVETPDVKPLWNPGADLTKRFGLSVKTRGRAGSGTTSCLRCHDGTVAPSNISAAQRTEFVNKTRSARFAPAHGGSNHPVGIDYPLFDRRGFRPANVVTNKGTVVLPNGKVECLSCHDPHNGAGQKYFLVTSNSRSALCLTCHRK
jgi:predicted CXXCH cytochrome family protein